MTSILIHKPLHHTRPGRIGNGALRLSYSRWQSPGNVRHALRCLPIRHKLNPSYESDLDMS